MGPALRAATLLALALLLVPLLASGEPATAASPLNLVVGFRDLPAGLDEGDAYRGGTVTEVLQPIGFAVVRHPRPADFHAWARGQPAIRLVVPEVERQWIEAAVVPNDPLFSAQHGPQQVRLPLAWSVATGDADAAVCIVDSGIDLDHPDLAASIVNGTDTVGDGDPDPSDGNGHGTHVAGVAAAVGGNGLGMAGAARVPLYVAKVLTATGAGTQVDIAEGILWCADHTPERTVINLSLGYHCTSAPSCANTAAQIPALLAAIEYANSTGKLVVAAAGNTGSAFCVDCVVYPARHADAVAVGCTTQGQALCTFSSRGPKVEVSAPGQSILSTVPPCSEAGRYCSTNALYRALSGTSMSSPLVAGVAALLWSHEPGLTNWQLRQRIGLAVQDLGAQGRDLGFGLGRIDAACALGAVANAAPSAMDDLGATVAGQPVTLAVLANDADAECGALRVVGVGAADIGLVDLAPSGGLVYTPPPLFEGVASFTYTVGDGQTTDEATVTVTVGPPPCAEPGPDRYGYRCAVLPLGFTDIAADGTVVPEGGRVAIPFPFRFYGARQPSLYVHEDGLASFRPFPSDCCTLEGIRDRARPNPLVAAAAAPVVLGSAEVRTAVVGSAPDRALLVQWTGLEHAAGGTATVQLALREGSDAIDVSFPQLDWAGPMLTGIEDTSGLRGLAFADGPAVGADHTVRFWRPKADLAAMAAPVQGIAGEPFAFELGAANAGPDDAIEARVSFRLPGTLALAGPLPDGCTLERRAVACDLGSVPAGENATRTLLLLADRPMRATSFAQAGSDLLDPRRADDRKVIRIHLALPGPP